MKRDSEVPQVDTHWFSESGIIDVFFLLGPTTEQVMYQYATITGMPSMPPVSYCLFNSGCSLIIM